MERFGYSAVIPMGDVATLVFTAAMSDTIEHKESVSDKGTLVLIFFDTFLKQ
jgi:hypothetical protein